MLQSLIRTGVPVAQCVKHRLADLVVMGFRRAGGRNQQGSIAHSLYYHPSIFLI